MADQFEWDEENAEMAQGAEAVLEEQSRDFTYLGGEALKRIEQAKLYESLLTHDLFGPGSARPEIMEEVEREIKSFVAERLEILVGMRQAGTKQVITSSAPLFSDAQVEALKVLADKVLKKENKPQEPEVMPLQATQAIQVNSVSVNRPASTAPTGRPSTKVQVKLPEAPKKATKRPKSNNVSKLTGQDYSQAISDVAKPKPMPSQAVMDQMNAQQAAGARRANPLTDEEIATGASTPAGSIASAIQLATHQNRNVREDNE